jgi:hypothetical protein
MNLSNITTKSDQFYCRTVREGSHFILFPNLHHSILQEWTAQKLLQAPS